ncbi:hypothetical protein [Mesorhizobium sp. M0816]|uniref:hypothetical protein n=1 Tax=Mesorhizobium sp. M0816 TaxID=2957006 RepID=UPI00333DEB33
MAKVHSNPMRLFFCPATRLDPNEAPSDKLFYQIVEAATQQDVRAIGVAWGACLRSFRSEERIVAF